METERGISAATRVGVCVLTHRRPSSLRRTLDSLNDLVRIPGVEIRVLVVDNDAAGSGRPVVQELRAFSLPLSYVHEPRNGIPGARNTALEATADADVVAFIDDDEWAEPEWLSELLDARARSGADIVVGPVVPDFEADPPGWLSRLGYFEPLRYEALTDLHFAYTGNVLIDRRILDTARPFREARPELGGSDTHFFMRLSGRGVRIVWAPLARVHE